MAKKPVTPKALTFVQIVMGADAEVIKAAYDARVKVDDLLQQREEAYRQIQALEEQVDDVMGAPGVYVFPAPPYPVAGPASGGRAKKAKTTAKPAAPSAPPPLERETPVEHPRVIDASAAENAATPPEPTEAPADGAPSANSATDTDADTTSDKEVTDDK